MSFWTNPLGRLRQGGNVPGFKTVATSLMKRTCKKKGVATIGQLRAMSLESGAKLIGCRMTMGVFGFSRGDFVHGVEIGGAAMLLEFARGADSRLLK